MSMLYPCIFSNGTTDPGDGTRRTYKPTSFYQLLRRLGFFPTETTKRATHGLDFEGSRTFKWNGSRRQKYIQSKKEKDNVSRSLALEVGNRRHSVANVSAPVIPLFEMGSTFDIGLHSVITSEPGMHTFGAQVPLATQDAPQFSGALMAFQCSRTCAAACCLSSMQMRSPNTRSPLPSLGILLSFVLSRDCRLLST